MTFANPAMLWSLLALVPLIGVYFLKVRPRRRPTTAYFLWERIFHERRSNRLWHRLRNLFSLLLMALTFAAVALALAEPRFEDRERPDLLIVVDNSASMQALVGGDTRLELAKQEAADIARALDGVQRAAVATIADRLRYVSHLTDNPRELLAAIEGIEPTYEPFRAEALPASSAEDPNANPQKANESEEGLQDELPQDWSTSRKILLISDGVMGRSDTPEGIELVRVGADSEENIGIVAADVQFTPGVTDRLSFYYQIASTAEEVREADLLLSWVAADGQEQLKKVIPIEARQGLNQPQVLSVDDARPGRWVAKLDLQDSLETDNVAYLVARRPPPIRVGVLSEDTFFFENSVAAFSHASGGLELTSEQVEIVLAKGSAADADRAIVFQPSGESPWWNNLGEELEVAAPKVLEEDHPLLRHVDPLSMSFLGARKLDVPSGSQILVTSETGVPLIYVAKASGKAAVVLNLDPVAAEFYFSAWFPTLVRASAMHLAGREEPLLAAYPTAAEVELPSVEPAEIQKIAGPNGAKLQRTASSPLRLTEPGYYEVEGSESSLVSSSLLSAEETLLEVAGDEKVAASVASGTPLSAWLVFLAMVVVTTESALYHRRKVG